MNDDDHLQPSVENLKIQFSLSTSLYSFHSIQFKIKFNRRIGSLGMRQIMSFSENFFSLLSFPIHHETHSLLIYLYYSCDFFVISFNSSIAHISESALMNGITKTKKKQTKSKKMRFFLFFLQLCENTQNSNLLNEMIARGSNVVMRRLFIQNWNESRWWTICWKVKRRFHFFYHIHHHLLVSDEFHSTLFSFLHR
jgi:hypothetical protein